MIRRSTTHHQAVKFGCCLQREVRDSHQTDVTTATLKFETTGMRAVARSRPLERATARIPVVSNLHAARDRTPLTAGASGQASSSSVTAADNSEQSPNKDVWGLLQDVLAVALLVCKLFLQLVVDGLRACCLVLNVAQSSLQQQLTSQQTTMGQMPRQGETAGDSLQQQQQQRIQSKQANSSILMLADEQAARSRLQQKLADEQANSSRMMQMLEDQQAALRSMEQRLAAEQATHSRLQHRSAARNIPTNPWNASERKRGQGLVASHHAPDVLATSTSVCTGCDSLGDLHAPPAGLRLPGQDSFQCVWMPWARL